MKQKPTTSQYSYMVTGLLTAKIQRNGVITQDDVKEAVETAKMAYDMIAEAIGEVEDIKPTDESPKFIEGGSPLSDYVNRQKNIPKHETIPPGLPNYFEDYEWKNGVATWTELAAWLRLKGVTSNRRISIIFRVSIERGYIRRDENTHKYLPPLP